MEKKVVIKVVSCPAVRCECGYKEGQEWIMNGPTLPSGICIGAMSALLPWITCIKYGAQMPWAEKGKIDVCCTDPDHPVKFQISIE